MRLRFIVGVWTSLIFESGRGTKRGSNYITNARPAVVVLVRACMRVCVCVGGARCGYDDDGNVFVWMETAEAENEVIESG